MKKISPWKLSALGILTSLMVITFACNEEMDAEIKKMGETANSIPFEQLPMEMQSTIREKGLQKELSYVVTDWDEDSGINNEAIESQEEVLIRSINKEEGKAYLALVPDSKFFDYLSQQSKTDNEIFTIVEEQPEFPGGMKAFYDYVASSIMYPTSARKEGIEGRVYVQFVVQTDGTVGDIKAVKGIGGGCDEEAMRVMFNAPKFTPGKQRDQNVPVRMVLPIIFRLDGEVSPTKSRPLPPQGPKLVEGSKDVYTIIDKQPAFPEDMGKYYEFISNNINYPAQAKDAGIEGRVFVQFIVNEDGSLSDIQAVKGIGNGCDEEAERLIRKLPDFTPGELNEKNVKVRMVLPVDFKLN